MKLSIIICLYNTKREYLEECLLSIRSSTLDKNDYEILLIDDGSKESYKDIATEYEAKYVRTENRGHLAARLYGIMLAKGDYIAFCDSDDGVSVNYYAPMLRKAEKENSDIVLSDWAFYTENGRSYCPNDIIYKNEINLENQEILDFYLKGEGRYHSIFVLWNKIIKREVMLKAKSELEKTDAIMHRLSYSEDALITYFAYKCSSKIGNVHSGFYFYRIHKEQSVAVSRKEVLEKHIFSMTKTLDVIKNDLAGNEDGLAHLKKWGELMSRTHYSYAKMGGYTDLYPMITEKYGVERLQISKASDEPCHANGHLGKNFSEIDNVLYAIYKIPSDVCVDYPKNDKYITGTIKYLEEQKGRKIIYMKGAKIKIPKRKVSFKDKTIKSGFGYGLAKRIFKKGTKLRAKLKENM